ncbi:putative glutamic acid-rich protein-like isoform X1 [Sesbania bispinosa]|nr:putative glutamic acid-rich protein-like isoform X1 [Sesbania bispinosa]
MLVHIGFAHSNEGSRNQGFVPYCTISSNMHGFSAVSAGSLPKIAVIAQRVRGYGFACVTSLKMATDRCRWAHWWVMKKMKEEECVDG